MKAEIEINFEHVISGLQSINQSINQYVLRYKAEILGRSCQVQVGLVTGHVKKFLKDLHSGVYKE